MPAMETFAAKHAAKIRGTLSCFDRVLFRGYLPLMSGWAMADFLWSKQIDRKKLKPAYPSYPQPRNEAGRENQRLFAVVGSRNRHAALLHVRPSAIGRLAEVRRKYRAHFSLV
jgi:hypothetical protein